ncbi:hypothetical protein Enr8_50590 [Blastopirellula retiformator]|uniref:DUF1795 domain-containing protein n=2 Tax=Blastopirellula retiformator TaxID=2527970 RepID=A0A5C5UVV4_9BACT|nr:hypothetical protein Enr8_50590 [Blastopirellula retiformator]
MQLVTYHGARHPFAVDLPTHNVVIFQHGSDTVYQWAPGPGGGPNARTVDRRFLFRVVHHHRLPGEGDLAAIERLEQTHNIGWPGRAFPPERIARTTPTIDGYRAVDRQLIGDNSMVWMSLSVAHPSGIYHLQGMGRPTDVTSTEFEAIKNSFRFTR